MLAGHDGGRTDHRDASKRRGMVVTSLLMINGVLVCTATGYQDSIGKAVRWGLWFQEVSPL